MKSKGHGTVRGFSIAVEGRLVNYTGTIAAKFRPDAESSAELASIGDRAKIVAVRVITEGEFQRLVKRAIANDTYDLFHRRKRNA